VRRLVPVLTSLVVIASCSSGPDPTQGVDAAGGETATSVSGDPPAGDGPNRDVDVSDQSSTPTPPASTPPASTLAPPDPVVDEVLIALGAMLDDDGVLPVDDALAIVAALVAPLPGVTPADFDGDLPHDLAGLAVRRLQGARELLDDEVLATLEAALAPGPDEEEVEITEGRRRPIGDLDGPITEPTAGELALDVAGIIAELEERSGHDLRLPVRARVVSDRATGGSALTSAIYVGGRVTGCRVALPRGMFAGAFGPDRASVVSTIAHEVWHCFQLDDDTANPWAAANWVVEGQAEWVGESIAGGSVSSTPSWDTWLLRFDVSLFRRTYDAIGIYATAARAGSDPWPVLLDMFGPGNFGAVETLFGGTIADAVGRAARSQVRNGALGAAWELDGPGITAAKGSTAFAPTPDAGPTTATTTAGRFSVLPLELVVAGGDVLRISVTGGTGWVQMPGSAEVTVDDGGTASWCLRPEGCVCEDGSLPLAVGGADLVAGSPGVGGLALGTLTVSTLAVVGEVRSLAEACRRGIVGVWRTDAGIVLDTLIGALVGSGGPDCNGPYTITFSPDGTFRAEYEMTCRIGEMSGSGAATFGGPYTDLGGSIDVGPSSGGGSVVVGGITVPLPPLFGARTVAEYVVDGDQLSITFDVDGTSVTLGFERAG
jgi:hypothetical protein